MKKLILSALVAAMLFSAACSSAPVANDGADTTAASVTETETEADTTPQFAEADFEGYDYRMFCNDRSSDTVWTNEFYEEVLTGEPIRDSVYNRNKTVEDKYNITLSYIPTSAFAATVKKNVNASDNSFDLVASDLFAMTEIQRGGCLVDMNSIASLDLSLPWWDASSVRDLSIGKHQYFVTGDIDYRSYIGAWIYLFSKTVVTNYNLENPYDLIASGDWTVDKFIDMTKGIAGDVDGDGKMNQNDRYGLITESYNSLGMFFGAGCVVIEKDEENYPVIAVNTPRGEEVVSKVLEMMNDADSVAFIDQSWYNWDWYALDAVFSDERGLFYSIVLSTVMRIRSADVDFGIIPMPKYDSAQESYCTWVSPFIANAVGFPITTDDAERLGVITEYLGYTSQQQIKPTVYDITLQRKLARDDESADMLDLIFKNRVYDLGSIYDWGGVGTFIPNLSFKSNANFTTQYASLEGKAQAALEVTITEMKGLN